MSSPTPPGDPADVARALALQVPVVSMPPGTPEEFADRYAQVLEMFGYATKVTDGVIEFPDGIEAPDQPLAAALQVLVAQRFPYVHVHGDARHHSAGSASADRT